MPRRLSHFTLKTVFALAVFASISAATNGQGPLGGNSVINSIGEQWFSIGPSGIPLNNLDVISGQVNVIAVDPRDARTVYAGASEGGVWKTTDGGFTWRPLTDFKLVRSVLSAGTTLRRKGTSAIGAIAIDQGRPNTIYVGTGNPNVALNFNAPRLGVFRSTDGGETWSAMGSDPRRSACPSNARMSEATAFRLVVSSGNPTVVYAATDLGVFRYVENDTDCWTRFNTLPEKKATDIISDDYRRNLYVVFPGDGIFKATDPTVDSWTKLTNGLPAKDIGRVALAFGGRTVGASPPEPIVYAGYEILLPNGGRTYQLYKTSNGGDSWTQLPSPPNQSSMIAFANALAVGMHSSDDVYVGQINLWRALDGGRKGGLNDYEPASPITGNSWFDVSCCQTFENRNPLRSGLDLHADIHDIVFAPHGSFIPSPSQMQIVYVANDGGVTRGIIDSTGNIDWRPMTLGLAIGQVGTVSIQPTNPAVSVSGLWHNANAWSSTTVQHPLPIGFGDGYETGIDAGINDDGGTTVYHNCNAQDGTVCRSKTGPSLSPPSEMIWPTNGVFHFWSDPYRPGHFLLLKWDGLLVRHKTANTSPAAWLRNPAKWQSFVPLPGQTGNVVTLAFRSALLENEPIYYLGTASGQIWRGSPEAGWTKICECGQEIAGIGPDLTRNERIFVVLKAPIGQGRIKELTRKPDGSWTNRNIDENFRPELEVSELTSIVVDPIVPDPDVTTVYVGTDQGVYRGRFQKPVIGSTSAAPATVQPGVLQWTWTRSPGVPNVKVSELKVHQSPQLGYQTGIIRAATYGRSNFQLDRNPGRVVQRFPLALEVTAAESGSELPRPLKVQIEVAGPQQKSTQQAPFAVKPNEVTELVLIAPPEWRDEEGRVLRFAGWVVDGERRGVRNILSLNLDQITKAVAHYAVYSEPQPPAREAPLVSISAEGGAICVEDFTHQLKVAWHVIGESPVTMVLEFHHPDKRVEIDHPLPRHGTQRFVVNSPKGGLTRIKMTVVDGNKVKNTAQTTVLLPPCR